MGPRLLFLVIWLTEATVIRDLTKIDMTDEEIIRLINNLYRSRQDHARLQRSIRHMERMLFELRDKSRTDHSQQSYENFRNYVNMLKAKRSTANSPHHRRKSDTDESTRTTQRRKRKSPKPRGSNKK